MKIVLDRAIPQHKTIYRVILDTAKEYGWSVLKEGKLVYLEKDNKHLVFFVNDYGLEGFSDNVVALPKKLTKDIELLIKNIVLQKEVNNEKETNQDS